MTPNYTLRYNCGTKGFRAPEAKYANPCDQRVDLYSLGIVLCHLLIPHLFADKDVISENLVQFSKFTKYAVPKIRKQLRSLCKYDGDLARLSQTALRLSSSNPNNRYYPHLSEVDCDNVRMTKINDKSIIACWMENNIIRANV